jgi:hypothetical protein
MNVDTPFGARRAWRAILLFLAIALMSGPLFAQGTGSIEFDARVTPSGARPEPVRQLTFYLLRRSLDDIRSEAAAADPQTNLTQFIDTLGVSPELKAWMKKHQTVQLAGASFQKTLTASDIVDTPEFFKAYMLHTADSAGVAFPKPKFKEKDRIANPEKYDQQKLEYKDAISKFITAVPDSAQGLEVDLNDINPYQKWMEIVGRQNEHLQQRTFETAQTRDLILQTDTNLDGRGAFTGVAPGEYWIATLDMPAIAGDVRLAWDVRVTVRAGEVTRVGLSNLNAALR